MGQPACHEGGAAHPPQHTIMDELGPLAPYHYKHSHQHLILAECLKTSDGLEGTWSMRQVVLFRFVGVCALLVEAVVSITRKTQFATGQGEGFYFHGCDICTKYQFACFFHVLVSEGCKTAQELEICGQSHDVPLLFCSSVSHQVSAVNQRMGPGCPWQRNPCQNPIES